MKNFIINYDEALAMCRPEQLITFMRYNKLVSSWSAPFSGAYFIKSEHSLTDVQNSFEELIGKNNFFIAEVGPFSSGGRMDPRWWDWFNSDIIQENMLSLLKKD